ncbi:MAG TPA: DUF3016 domain-containing protein [Dokdonella sp.]|nr:DUF3016 domain-containing protein [Dokdonella sp.]
MHCKNLALRTLASLALAIAALGGAAAAFASEAANDSARVSVTWTDPAQFTEMRYSHGLNRPKPESWLNEMRKTVVRRADRLLKPGQRLDVTITDVKLAGQYEPWRGPNYNDVRIVKSLYPPSIDLRFSLVDADGKVIDSGERKLRDPAFLNRGSTNSSESYRFEKRLLKDWLAREFEKKDA